MTHTTCVFIHKSCVLCLSHFFLWRILKIFSRHIKISKYTLKNIFQLQKTNNNSRQVKEPKRVGIGADEWPDCCQETGSDKAKARRNAEIEEKRGERPHAKAKPRHDAPQHGQGGRRGRGELGSQLDQEDAKYAVIGGGAKVHQEKTEDDENIDDVPMTDGGWHHGRSRMGGKLDEVRCGHMEVSAQIKWAHGMRARESSERMRW